MTNETEHFNGRVSQALRDKLHALATLAKDDFISDCGRGESYGCTNINAIYGYHISGFIPSQLGGFEVSELYRCDTDPSYHFNAAQSAAVECYDADCLQAWAWDNREELAAQGVTFDYRAFTWDMMPESLRESFYDYENEWHEPALLRLELWVDDDKEQARLGNDGREPQSVFIRLSLNYRDAPYYRSKSDDTLVEFNVPIARFMRVGNETIIHILRKKI